MARIFRHARNAGFTLIETAASGIILAVVIYGLFVFISEADAMSRNGILRQRAIEEIDRVLSSAQFSHAQYQDLWDACPSDNVPLAAPLLSSVVLDERGGSGAADDITASITVSSRIEKYRKAGDVVEVFGVRLAVKAKWNDYRNTADSAVMEKIITNYRG